MFVCAHGNVEDFCKYHDMIILDRYHGDIESYRGICRVVVTDAEMSEHEYSYLKGKLFARGIELISTRYKDVEVLGYVAYVAQRESDRCQERHRGRCSFGYYRNGDDIMLHPTGERVVKRIFELRDQGYSYRMIREDEGVHHLDGGKVSISTLQVIVNNRKKYEEDFGDGSETR